MHYNKYEIINNISEERLKSYWYGIEEDFEAVYYRYLYKIYQRF